MSDAILKSYRFEQRAERYADWDRELRAKTRFFAAACLTNRVLGVLARMVFPIGVLRLVRSEIGARIEFARQVHRVRIGRELIEGIRDGEIAAQ
jgi:hypothetical protein